MWNLLPPMLERMGLIVTIAFLVTRFKAFRRMVQYDLNIPDRMVIMSVFGLFGIISTYTGIVVTPGAVVNQDWVPYVASDYAIANTRNVGVVIGGLLGGPAVGFGVGVIAGAHRYLLGGFTGLACMLSTIAGGLVAGWVGKRYRRQGSRMITPMLALFVGMLVEVLQMIILLTVAKPFEASLHLVQFIGLPMIAVNGFGVMIFVLILHTVLREEERTRAMQTQKALNIADRTLPYFRQGLNVHSCRVAAQIILQLTDADAIAITDRTRVLVHVGAADDHHGVSRSLATELTRKALALGKIVVAKSRSEIGCFHPSCPLQAAVVLPLKVDGETVGTLKLYFKNPHRLGTVERELAEGLAKLFSTQLELAEAERQSRLVRDAEIKALQAQVHPHFLFNAINTIVALCRTDVDLARKLLLQLSVFFRSNLQGARHMLIPLAKEMEHVNAYLSLEQARFPGRYEMRVHIEPGLEDLSIPPFTMQPLVENAVRHGFADIREGGLVEVEAVREGERIRIQVQDNGVGVPEEKLPLLGTQAVESEKGTGTALQNIRSRLYGLYGQHAGFQVENRRSGGVRVTLTIPYNRNLEEDAAYVTGTEEQSCRIK